MTRHPASLICLVFLGLLGALSATPARAEEKAPAPYVMVLGIAQDGGFPQTGDPDGPAWRDPGLRRLTSCLALVDPQTGERWIFEATPDFREQLHRLDVQAPPNGRPGIAGIFLTHAHMGHYTGLVHLGREALGANGVPVWAMPRMKQFLSSNGPWDQLVKLKNIDIRPLRDGEAVKLNDRLSVTPLLVPHRDEYSETVGYRIDGPERSVFFLPDIDKWERWDEATHPGKVEEVVRGVDRAYLDGTFFRDGEIPGRAMELIPHPFIEESLQRFRELPEGEKRKIRFIHFNRTNPVLAPDEKIREPARQTILEAGFGVAHELERFEL